MGQEELKDQLAEKEEELKKERHKYDKFLQRDKERLGYMTEMNNTRRLVQLSYYNEVTRQNKLKLEMEEKEKENLRQLEAVKEELAKSRQQARAKKSSNSNTRKNTMKKSNSKQLRQGEESRARLYMSIQSSRQKEKPKYVNTDNMKRMDFKTKYSTTKNQRNNSRMNAAPDKALASNGFSQSDVMSSAIKENMLLMDHSEGFKHSELSQVMFKSQAPMEKIL